MALNKDARVTIKADVQGEQALNKLTNSLQGIDKAAQAASSGGLAGLAGQLNELIGGAGPVGAAVAGLGALAATLGIAAKRTIDFADDINDMSQRTGASVESLAKFKVAADQSGTSIEGVGKGLVKLSRSIVDASSGNEELSKTFTALGVSIKNSDGSLRDTDQVMLDVADRFLTLEDGALKTEVAMRLFGKSGADLIPLLNNGRESIEATATTMNQELATAADELNDTITALNNAIGNLFVAALTKATPAIQSFTGFVNGILASDPEPWAQKWVFALESIGKAAEFWVTGGPAGAALRFLGKVREDNLAIGMRGISSGRGGSASDWAGARTGGSAATTGTTAGSSDLQKRLAETLTTPEKKKTKEPKFPAYIDKSVLRSWLQSQGFSRTSGDFTNRGHRTPNHMLNAMDMGWMSGTTAEAHRETAKMERLLRATGAFGGQLFGPISDPAGHGNGDNVHLHIPTPGGRVKMNAALASLMGLSKGSMAMDLAKWENKAADDAAKRMEKAAKEAEDAARKLRESNEAISRNNAEFFAGNPQFMPAGYRGPAAISGPMDAAIQFRQQWEEQQGIISGFDTRRNAIGASSNAYLLEAGGDPKKIERLQLINELTTQYKDLIKEIQGNEKLTSEQKQEQITKTQELINTVPQIADAQIKVNDTLAQAREKFDEAKAAAEDLKSTIADGIGSAIKTAIFDTQNLGSALAGIAKSIGGKLLDKFVINPLIGSLGLNALGNAYDSGGMVHAFASGGVVNSVTPFRFGAGKLGIMGEAGPEAIMPLQRTRDGRLGVVAQGGGGPQQVNQVTVNVDASGSKVSGDRGGAQVIGQLVAAEVYRVLEREQRPGGRLYG